MNKNVTCACALAILLVTTLSGCGGSSGGSSHQSSHASLVSSSVSSSSDDSSSESSSVDFSSLDNSSSSSSSSFDGILATYQAVDHFYSGGVRKSGSYLHDFSSAGARVIFTVNTPEAASYNARLHYANGTNTTKTLAIYVNGLLVSSTELTATGNNNTWAEKSETLALRKGLNTITYQYNSGHTGDVEIDYLALENGLKLSSQGATFAYHEYEAEDQTTTGEISTFSTTYLTAEGESSFRKHVTLDATGEYVEWTNTEAANSLLIRYSIPDALTGGGTSSTLSLYINGEKVRSLDLSSRYAWVYGDYPYNDNPANNKARRFFDEIHVSGINIPAGATVKLQKDADDSSTYYKIDLMDTELIDDAYSIPANFISITDQGATANDMVDDTQAIINTITLAKANNKGVWIPAGVFRMTNRVTLSDVHIRGAGMWHTSLQGVGGKGGFYGNGNNITLADLSIWGDSTQRNDANDHAGIEGNFGTGSLIQNVWIEHMKVGMWLINGTDGLYAVNGRIRNTWADGVNLVGGVKNSAVSQFSFRNTGDDSMAMWSQNTANDNNRYAFNTAQLPVIANGVAIYGGKDNKVLNNIISDTITSSAGIAISTRAGFPGTMVLFSGTTEVKHNILNRAGGYDEGWNTTFGALWIFADSGNQTAPVVIDDLVINNATYDAILMSYNKQISNISFNHVDIKGAGGFGINIANITGSGTFSNVKVTDALAGGLNNSTPFVINKGEGNTGW